MSVYTSVFWPNSAAKSTLETSFVYFYSYKCWESCLYTSSAYFLEDPWANYWPWMTCGCYLVDYYPRWSFCYCIWNQELHSWDKYYRILCHISINSCKLHGADTCSMIQWTSLTFHAKPTRKFVYVFSSMYEELFFLRYAWTHLLSLNIKMLTNVSTTCLATRSKRGEALPLIRFLLELNKSKDVMHKVHKQFKTWSSAFHGIVEAEI